MTVPVVDLEVTTIVSLWKESLMPTPSELTLGHGRGDGTFRFPPEILSTDANPAFVAIGDLTDDALTSLPDILVVTRQGTVPTAAAVKGDLTIFKNSGDPPTSFLPRFASNCTDIYLDGSANGRNGNQPGLALLEDLNGDTLPDVIREFTYTWLPVIHSEDRNFDTLIDHRWIYQKGKPAYFDVDLNADGKFDERTTYDPKGQPFYTDTRPGAEGPVLVRKILRDGIPWKILEDRDADNHFDYLTEFNNIAAPIREEELPGDSAENVPVPPWPPPPWPDSDDEDTEGNVEVKAAP